ncbi:uncharacterized protein CG43867-like isoform X9 [Tigriopus californicus]|uniref:uncharacterized protein CG43867-like isoform X9 n=1 Tax=Tigriopus californicus TaxID=6832 RepID=UPI0027DA4CD3|nr:uncharacterized protein CG43867-like isoform X9 [Tigriopus californicus]
MASGKRISARYSILSDPRLSQLFELSNQLEALADSIEVKPVTPIPNPTSNIMESTQVVKSNGSKTPNGNQPLLSPKPNGNFDIRYQRLVSSVDESNPDFGGQGSDSATPDENPISLNSAPPSRYSIMSDMSTSSQAESTTLGSTPSGHSLLSDSLIQSGIGGGLDSWMSYSAPNDVHLPISDSGWQERCEELESSLQKFRDQAQSIRELLKEKLSELEQRVVEAETRADDAEDKVRVMEQRLNEVDWTPNEESEPGDIIPPVFVEKDRLIRNLETEVEQQRQLRLADAKQVEAKAARIKDWVTNKLRELEEQNQHLKVQNAHCNEQMELLRKRLEQLQVMGASVSNHKSSSVRTSVAEDSSLGSLEGENGVSEESISEIGDRLAHVKQKSKDSSSRIRTTSNQGGPASSATLREGSRASKSRDSRVDSGSVDLETPQSEASSKSPLDALGEALGGDGMALNDYRPIPPPRSKLVSQLTSSPNSNRKTSRPESECILSSTGEMNASNTSGLLASLASQNGSNLPDKHRSLHVPAVPLEGKKLSKKKTKPLVMSDELHDYSEIYTPSNEEDKAGAWPDAESMSTAESSGGRTGSGDSGLTGLSGGTGTDVDQERPPPRPLHRYPSWENRIYEVAKEGVSGDQIDNTRNNNENRNSALLSGGYGDEINVPVYASLKGRASQIRSVPFTGDSSDSSDGEDNVDTGRGTSSRTTTASSTSGDISLTSPRNAVIGSTSPSPFKFTSTNTLTVMGTANLTSFSPIVTAVTSKSCSAGKLDTSASSDISNDYALPPDANLLDPDLGTAYHLASSTRLSCIESPRKLGGEKTLEKSGYLTKLGGKIKSWKRRYFVLKNGTLSYWKSLHDTHRKPQGLILLDESCRVSRTEGSNTFEIATANKTFYLTADSHSLVEEWVRVLQNVIQRNALKLLLSRDDQKPTLQGWLVKVKHGHAKKCWCVLLGKMFIYFRSTHDQAPTGQINMRDTHVEEVEHISDSDSDETEDGLGDKSSELTIGIFPNHVQQDPTYLIFGNKYEKEKWLYQLTVVSGGNPKAGTQFEQLVQKLMEEDGDPNSALWRHPLLVYSKDPITSPLTTFTSDTLQAEALKLFKSLQLFTSVVMDSAGIDYHVMLAANAFQQCLDVPELQPELLCALIKQTARVPSGHASSGGLTKQGGVQSFLMNATQLFTCDANSAQKSSSTIGSSPSSPTIMGGDSKSNPSNCVFIQGWMLMSLAVSIFVPKDSKILWFLRTHFKRNKNSKTESGKYAAYCNRALERAVYKGHRQARPSRMEVLSILLKNPHQHSLPHALPVHFLNDTYQVVGFDGSTTIAEFMSQLNQDIGCRPGEQSGFAIYSDDPIDTDVDHALHLDEKVCDVISRWETALREKGLGKFENKRVIRFSYRNRMYWRRNVSGEGDRERLLLAYQVSKQIVNGQFPLNKDLAFELTALMAQIHFGDLNKEKTSKFAPEALERFYPSRYLDGIPANSDERNAFQQYLMEKWTSLKGKTTSDCVRIFLTCTRKWQFFGAKLFQVQAVTENERSDVWLAVHEDGISVLDYTSMQFQVRYSYDSIVTFGGCQDDFMLVISSEDLATGSASNDGISNADSGTTPTVKLLFQTRKPEILEITLLIADYMNMIGRNNPGVLTAPATPKLSSLSRNQSTRSSMRNPGSTVPNTPRLDHRSTDCLIRASTLTTTSSSGPEHHSTTISTSTTTTPKLQMKKRHQFDSGVA